MSKPANTIVRYSVWRDEFTQTFEVVMWNDKHPLVIKAGIKNYERAREIADRFQKRERANV